MFSVIHVPTVLFLSARGQLVGYVEQRLADLVGYVEQCLADFALNLLCQLRIV